MTDTNGMRETIILEKNLSLVLGHPVCLKSAEILRLTPETLKRAYYRRAHEFHPDKALSLGLDPEYLAGKFRSLQSAYSDVLESWETGSFAALIKQGEEPAAKGRGFAHRSGESRPAGSRNPTGNTGPTRAAGTGATSSAFNAAREANARQSRPSQGARPSGASSGQSRTWFSANAGGATRVYHVGKVPAIELRFAQYLYYTRRIDWNTLIKSLTWQISIRPKLGDLGIALGYMDADAVLAVLRGRKIGERFGEAAVRLGALSSGRLAVLMGRQRLLNMPIGRFFVEGGYLAERELPEALQSLARHNYAIRAGFKLSGNMV